LAFGFKYRFQFLITGHLPGQDNSASRNCPENRQNHDPSFFKKAIIDFYDATHLLLSGRMFTVFLFLLTAILLNAATA